MISRQYAENAKAFDSFELVACADLDESQARALAEAHDLRVASVDEVIGDPSIDVVLNLTPPAAHVEVIRACLAAGKHVYTEKPLATESRRRRRSSSPRQAGSDCGSGARRTRSSAAPTRRAGH